MCIGNLFGGQPKAAPTPPAPAPPSTPPPATDVVKAPLPLPETPTPPPKDTDNTKKKAKVVAKKTMKKQASKGTTQLQTKKPETGGLAGINTPQGINTGTGGTTAPATTTPKY